MTRSARNHVPVTTPGHLPLSAAQIEKLRNIGLIIRANGSIEHQGDIVSHERLRKAILCWLDVVDGRHVVRLDDKRYAYATVEDAPLLVESARVEGTKVELFLNSGECYQLAPDTLRYDDSNDALYCRVKDGKLEAKFSPRAQASLMESCLEESEHGFAIRIADVRYPVRYRE